MVPLVVKPRSKNSPQQAIPVIFNLSSWTNNNLSLTEWLIYEVKSKYNVGGKLAREWLKQYRILSLLDGLDEVKSENLNGCIRAINNFTTNSEYGTPGLVVCSRLQEYTSLSLRLKLNSAVCIRPLTFEQAINYLEQLGPQVHSLREVLKLNQPLQELAQSPLMLGIMSLAYQDKPLETIIDNGIESVERRSKHLFDVYVERMFERKGRKKSPYTKENVKISLLWLAKRMKEHSHSIFLLENLQRTWLSTWGEKLFYFLGLYLVFGSWFGLFYSWTLGLSKSRIYGLIFGLIFGLILALLLWVRDIRTTETLVWSRKKFKKGLKKALYCGLITGVIIFLASMFTWGLVFAVTMMPLAVIVGIFLFSVNEGFESEALAKVTPNRGIHLSLVNGIKMSCTYGLILGLPICVITAFIFNVFSGIVLGLTFGLIFGIVGLIRKGGADFIMHYNLRLILFLSGKLPLNSVKFFDYCSSLIFLKKVGGGYIFIHHKFLEYFADIYLEKNEKSITQPGK